MPEQTEVPEQTEDEAVELMWEWCRTGRIPESTSPEERAVMEEVAADMVAEDEAYEKEALRLLASGVQPWQLPGAQAEIVNAPFGEYGEQLQLFSPEAT